MKMAGNSNEANYRKEQMEFYSNTHGTTARETMILIIPSICSLLLILTTRTLIGKYFNSYTIFVLEFIINFLPSILCCTIYSDAKISVCVTLLALSFANFLLIALTTDIGETGGGRSPPTIINRRPFITNFRALTLVLSAICILAVDFKAFPRRFAKTEAYGYSLMDTGVGFFILTNALVSQEARDFDRQNKFGFLKTVIKNFVDCVRSCITLIILGSARYFSVEYLNYQKQITEYGVHWNFFITLAAVKILTSILTTLISAKRSLLVGISILATHEYILSRDSVKQWLSGSSREGFINANREGIISTLGYVGLYFVGVAVGRLIHSTYRRASQSAMNKSTESTNFHFIFFEAQYSESMILCVKLSLIAAQSCAGFLFLDHYLTVSRKFANAGYCAWMITLSTVMLTLLLLIDVVADILRQLIVSKETDSNKRKNKRPKKDIAALSSTPDIFEAVNYNGLAFFLLSNLLTGAINMSIKTLHVEDLDAVKIITAYMGFGAAFFTILYQYKIRIKL